MLSETVANAFDFYGDEGTLETQRFILKFDTFFDCLNGRHPSEHIKRRKPNLKPYTSPVDERFKVCLTTIMHENVNYASALLVLQWLEEDFLGYLNEWEASVNAREGISDAEKASMLLSQETLEGLHITGLYTFIAC